MKFFGRGAPLPIPGRISKYCAAAGAARSIRSFPRTPRDLTRARSSTPRDRTSGRKIFRQYRGRARNYAIEFWRNGPTSCRKIRKKNFCRKERKGRTKELGVVLAV